MSDQKPSVSKGQQFHSFLQERGVEVPSDYNVFATEMQGENGKAFHGFLQERGVEVPSSYDDFASVFAPDVKKKKVATPLVQVLPNPRHYQHLFRRSQRARLGHTLKRVLLRLFLRLKS